MRPPEENSGCSIFPKTVLPLLTQGDLVLRFYAEFLVAFARQKLPFAISLNENAD